MPSDRIADLYARYSEELLMFIRSLLPISKADAADLLHQVFVDLIKWDDKNPDRAIEHPRAFVYKFAQRRVGKHLDKLRRTPSSPSTASPGDALDSASAASEDDVEFLAGRSNDRRGLLRAMRKLGNTEGGTHQVSDLQLIIYLRFWLGMTETEIGKVLDHSRATIARRLRKAKVELFARLEELELREPGTTATSTTLLHRWWRGVEVQANEFTNTEKTAKPEE